MRLCETETRSSMGRHSHLLRLRSTAIQRGSGVLRLQPRDRGWIANVSLPSTEAGHEVIPRVWSDSSACRGIVGGTGSDRLKFLEIRRDAVASAERERSC